MVETYEQIGERINKKLSGLDSIKSREEYYEKLETYLGDSKAGQSFLNAKTRSWESIREEFYEETDAKKIVEANSSVSEEGELKARAVRFENSRSVQSRIRDESRTARNTRSITRSNFLSWRRSQGRSGDLRGIDTRNMRRVNALRKRIIITQADRRLRNVKVFINPKLRYKAYRSAKSGRFVKSPFKRKKA